MLKRCIAAENRKLHRSPIWLLFFVMPLISASYGTFNYLQNLEILHERWYSLWTQHTLFYSMLFFPAMVAAYAAYLWRLEHMGHNIIYYTIWILEHVLETLHIRKLC